MLPGLSEMDARFKDGLGNTICPNCGKHYLPDLGERKCAHLPIQVEFPFATPMQREQLITGICSDKCWQEYLHGED